MSIGRWLRDHPRLLERAYSGTHKLIQKLGPLIQRLGYGRANQLLRGPEELSKKIVFDCRMCGQCVLHSTGMTCPMTCPKNLRNGPCGGVRLNGHCEVIPEMRCVWVEAFERSLKMGDFGNEMLHINPPVNRLLEGTSAWVNMLTGEDKNVPKGWVGTSQIQVMDDWRAKALNGAVATLQSELPTT
jgi:hypothetical protein